MLASAMYEMHLLNKEKNNHSQKCRITKTIRVNMPKEYNFKKILQQLVKDFDGIDIFSEENALRLNKALNRLDEKFSVERETLLVANKCNVSQCLYAVISNPQADKTNTLKECEKDLLSNGIEDDACKELLSNLSVILYQSDLTALEKDHAKTETIEKKKSAKPNNNKKNENTEDSPIDNQDIRHWNEKKFYKNVLSSNKFKNADLATKKEMHKTAKAEAKMIKALRRDAGMGGGCYITTAICEASGKPDDCYELTTLRNFRDNWLAKQPDGLALISEYYKNAPKIVDAINALKNRNSIYAFLNKSFLKKCLAFIKNNQMMDCKKCYMDMVHYCSKFLNKV